MIHDTFMLTCDKTSGEIVFFVALIAVYLFRIQKMLIVSHRWWKYACYLTTSPSLSIPGLYICSRFKDMFVLLYISKHLKCLLKINKWRCTLTLTLCANVGSSAPSFVDLCVCNCSFMLFVSKYLFMWENYALH